MQTISQNPITQTKHGLYNAVDIGDEPDPFYYAPEDGLITSWGQSGTCGLRLELQGASGRHGFCHNEYSLVKVGQKVQRGQMLAKMGYTGLTDPDDVPEGTHVHWVIQKNGKYIYPPSLVNESFKKGEIMPAVKIVGAPASVSNATGRIDVVVRGSDNGLYHKWYDKKWSDWERWGGGIASSPSISSWGVGRYDIFATGVAGDLMHFYYVNNKISAPESLGVIKKG